MIVYWYTAHLLTYFSLCFNFIVFPTTLISNQRTFHGTITDNKYRGIHASVSSYPVLKNIFYTHTHHHVLSNMKWNKIKHNGCCCPLLPGATWVHKAAASRWDVSESDLTSEWQSVALPPPDNWSCSQFCKHALRPSLQWTECHFWFAAFQMPLVCSPIHLTGLLLCITQLECKSLTRPRASAKPKLAFLTFFPVHFRSSPREEGYERCNLTIQV